eukprot:m.66211 g.66211  ORF g.66211 m.66211 type:complete len:143 (+) comp15931_c0_seq1:279-707(+)
MAGIQQPEENAADLEFGPVFGSDSAFPLLISEVQSLLEQRKAIEDKANAESGDTDSTSETFQKTLHYCEKFGQFNNREKVAEVRQLLSETSLHKFEQAALANLCPSDVDEAKAVIPSLQSSIDETDLEDLIESIQAFREFRE